MMVAMYVAMQASYMWSWWCWCLSVPSYSYSSPMAKH